MALPRRGRLIFVPPVKPLCGLYGANTAERGCHQSSGNIRCRKGGPCSTRAKRHHVCTAGSPALCAAHPPKGSLPAPEDAALPCGGASSLKVRCARASGGQGFFNIIPQ